MRYVVILVLAIVATVFMVVASHARDGWEGRPHVCDMPPGPRLEKCQYWIGTVQRPDIPGASCCGDGDAWISDNFRKGENGELIAIITADYPDGTITDEEGNTKTVPSLIHRGSEIVIPQEKIHKDPKDAGNTSGHGVVFIRPGTLEVLCYDYPPLT